MSTYTEDQRKVTTHRLIEMKKEAKKSQCSLPMIFQWQSLSMKPEWM